MESEQPPAGRLTPARPIAFFFADWSCIRQSTVKRLSLAIVAAVAGCHKADGPPPGAGGFAPAVTVAPAEARDVPIFLDEIGKAVAFESVTIQPQVTGKILARHFEDGADLKVDAPLFDIDPAPYTAAKHQAEGQLAKDTASFNNAKLVVQHDQDAVKGSKGAVAQTTMEADQAAMDESAAAIDADKAAVEAADVNLKFCTIKSPIKGKAGIRMVDVGNVVTPAGQGVGSNLLTIQNLDSIYIDFTIPESELPRVNQFMSRGKLMVEATLPQDAGLSTGAVHPTTTPTAAPGTAKPVEPTEPPMAPTTMPSTMPADGPRQGELTVIDNSVQDGTGTVKLRAKIANADHHFWPNDFVLVKLILEVQKGAIVIPRQATQISQTGPFVYVVDDKSLAHIAPIGLGQRQGEMVMVESGLVAGDKVVVTGQTLVQDKTPVMVVPSGPPAGPGGH